MFSSDVISQIALTGRLVAADGAGDTDAEVSFTTVPQHGRVSAKALLTNLANVYLLLTIHYSEPESAAVCLSTSGADAISNPGRCP